MLFNQISFLKKSKNQASNLSTIYLRITLNGARTEISTQRQCEPKKWLPQAGSLIGKTENIRALNEYLDAVKHRIYNIYKELIVAGTESPAN